MFQVVRIPEGAADLPEQVGTKAKFWLDGNRRLFKEGRPGTGENWAEVVAARIASGLGLPHAPYELATYEDRFGVVTETFVPPHGRLVLGNELIGRVSRGEMGEDYPRREFHTVGRIAALLNAPGVAPPLGWQADCVLTASDVMSGYLLLDAVIGNQDRHEENWGLISSRGAVYLAPTFDHASSMGRNETDQRRKMKLEAKHPDHGIRGFTRRAKTPIYDAGSPLHPADAFHRFAGFCPNHGAYWLKRLQHLTSDHVASIFAQVPNDWISEAASRFGLEMICANRERLLTSP